MSNPSFIQPYHIILASRSPRRQYLLKELGLHFEVRTKETDESFPETLKAEQIPLFLCRKKAEAFTDELKENELLITADTIVWINGQVLNKPENAADAFRMLRLLAGTMHEVFTGVCLATAKRTHTFFVRTRVLFKPAGDEEIKNYIAICKPYDKAGSYGAQECLPDGMKPCSEEEVAFLLKHHCLHLNTAQQTDKIKGKGYVEVERFVGSYFNVMGLPLVELYRELKHFIS